MIPTIGLMVCITGMVICGYVLARMIEISQQEHVGKGLSMLLFLIAFGALGGGFGLAMLGMDLTSTATRAGTRPDSSTIPP